MGASQPSARSRFATGPVVRAVICIGYALGSLTAPALAQAPAPTPELQNESIQPWQAGKPVEFRQPCPVASGKVIPGNSALAKPGNEGAGPAVPSDVEREVLLPLLLEEKRLLVDYGPDHPDVCSIRERIQLVREYLTRHRPAPPPNIHAPLPPIPVQTPHREIPGTTASTSNSPRQTTPLPLPPVGSQILEPGRTKGGSEAKDRWGDTQTVTPRGQPELIRPIGFSTAGNPIRDAGTARPNLADPPPTVVRTKDKDTHPTAIATTNKCAQAVVSTPSDVGDKSASQLSQEQKRDRDKGQGNSFFDAGFGQLVGIVGAILFGVLIHLITLVFILRRYIVHLARVSRVELVNPAAVGFVVGESAAGAQTIAAAPATREVTQSSTAETFDIGPTYAEEMRQKQEAEKQQEEAVLRHIFELNMQMREQLRQLSGESA